jgi:hypothetical protein
MVRATKLAKQNQQEDTMNKLYISIVAFAALSSATYANTNRSNDVRDSDTCMGTYCNNVDRQSNSTTLTVVTPLAVIDEEIGLSNFERTKKISEENDRGRH